MAENYDVIVVGAGPAGSGDGGAAGTARGARGRCSTRRRFRATKRAASTPARRPSRSWRASGALRYVERARPRRAAARCACIAPNGAASAWTTRRRARGQRAGDARRAPGRGAGGVRRRTGAPTLRERTRVVDVSAGGGAGARRAGRQGAGRQQEFRAPLVVGADGGHSVVARALGLARAVRWPRNAGHGGALRGRARLRRLGRDARRGAWLLRPGAAGRRPGQRRHRRSACRGRTRRA